VLLDVTRPPALSTQTPPTYSLRRRHARAAKLPLRSEIFVPTLRCTARLLKRLNQKAEPHPPAPENRLGDWYANLLYVGPHRLVLVTSERSLLPLIVPIKDSSHLRERIREHAHAFLYHLGVPPDLAAAEVRDMQHMPFAKTASRQVLGSMNDFAFSAEVYLHRTEGAIDLADLQLFLASMPCSPLKYLTPIEATRQLFETS
jgi:hypothetical protein